MPLEVREITRFPLKGIPASARNDLSSRGTSVASPRMRMPGQAHPRVIDAGDRRMKPGRDGAHPRLRPPIRGATVERVTDDELLARGSRYAAHYQMQSSPRGSLRE